MALKSTANVQARDAKKIVFGFIFKLGEFGQKELFLSTYSEVSPEGGEEIFESWPEWRCFDWLHHASDNVAIVTTCHICTTLHDHFDLRGSYSALRCSLHIGRYTLHSRSMASFCRQYWKVHWGLWGTH